MERFFGRAYSRFRRRPALFFGLLTAVAWIGMALLALVTISAGVLYVGWSFGEFIEITLMAWGTAVAGNLAGTALVWRRLIQPLSRWMTDQKSAPAALDAWKLAVAYPYRWATCAAVLNALLFLSIPTPYAASVADLGLGGYLALALAVSTVTLMGWCLFVFGYELAVRPLVEEIAVKLPPGMTGPLPGWRLRTRTLVPIPLLAATCALFGGAFVAGFDTPAAQLAAAGIAGGLFAALVTLIFKAAISNPVVRPVADLAAGAERVAAGNLDADVPVTSGDELGTLALAFNRMQAGLREREALQSRNAQLLEEVRASRARIVAASDAERRRVERNIHDGAQQRLVALALRLRLLEERARGDPEALRAEARAAGAELSAALAELRELAHGLHPPVLSTDGLAPALEQLAARAPLPVKVKAPGERYPDALESTAYFVASEALANVAKHSRASAASVEVERRDRRLAIEIADDGVGGADARGGSGLAGLADRVAAIGGTLSVDSPTGSGTSVRAELPLERESTGA